MKKIEKRTYIYAYDPKVKARVVYLRNERECISLVTGHKFNLTKKELKELEAEKGGGDMTIVLDHWNCIKCRKDKFHVILGKGKFKVAKIEKIICSNCGLIYLNENQEAKKGR